MSEFFIKIGGIDDASRKQACFRYLCDLGMKEHLGWMCAAPNIDELSSLNLSSVMLFLDHVARLDGFDGSACAAGRSRFEHLPWYLDSIWLPVAFRDPKVPLVEDNGFPVFLGSCQRLIENLEQIRVLSPLEMGYTPDGYDLMRQDMRAFCRSGIRLVDKAIIIQWVWKALHDGARLALQHDAPMLGDGC